MPFTTWQELSLCDLLMAYRKAKADCFYERTFDVSESFATFEEHIVENLNRLLSRLQDGLVLEILKNGVLEPQVTAKRLFSERKSADGGAAVYSHGFFSDPDRAFDRLDSTFSIEPEFRIVGNFNIEVHIISALWINLVGHKFDQKLSAHAYASRLRRYVRGRGKRLDELGAYQLEATGSFEPYFRPYRQWRDNGLQAIESALKNEEAVVAVTLDFSSYYHGIDARFIYHKKYLEQIGLTLNSWEIHFTKDVVDLIIHWSNVAAAFSSAGMAKAKGLTSGGIPIGLTAVRIIANMLLSEFDRRIVTTLDPVYYGRYVDDIFLVLKDAGAITNSHELWHHLSGRTQIFEPEDNGNYAVKIPAEYAGRTRLTLQPEKQKIFFLKGHSGLDLLENIASEIRNLSSERRLMPVPDQIDKSASARILASAADAADEAVSLRKADGLTVRRLGWSLQLRAMEILARDLVPGDWHEERFRFYRFASDHILRPDRILEQLDYTPRLISLAVHVGDWREAKRMYDAALTALHSLQGRTAGKPYRLNGVTLTGAADRIWDSLRARVRRSCAEAALKSIPLDAITVVTKVASSFLAEVGLPTNVDDLRKRVFGLLESDLARLSYKSHIKSPGAIPRRPQEREGDLLECLTHGEKIRDFVQRVGDFTHVIKIDRLASSEMDRGPGSLIPFIAPTRPFTAEEIAEFLPTECVFGEPSQATRNLAEYLRALRGVWWRASNESGPILYQQGPGEPPKGPIAHLSSDWPDAQVTLGITSLKTTDESWAQGAAGISDLSRVRFRRLAIVVNLALTADPRPTYLVLPELSLPEKWINTVSGMLREAGISLIAGLDYEVENTSVISSAILILSDRRLGYRSWVTIRQPKTLPAPGEEENLLRSHGLTWRTWHPEPTKPVYVHNNFHFGVLVCSELQNVNHRMRFQGQVDCLFCLSWNQDLETFSSLVESASLDVHAYIALVNNRKYGDSRVRSPGKLPFDRDLCRIKGGENEQLVVVNINPHSLRAQQSRSRRWSRPSDKFKPAPEGFAISSSRWTIPD